jgi:hypothetical protein
LLPITSGAADRDGTQSAIYLEYLNAPPEREDISAPPKLRLSFGGPSHSAIMDTGSTGIVVSANAIANIDTLPSTLGELDYSSSGRKMIGKWVTTPVRISGGNGASVMTKPIPVLAVTQIECTEQARNCRPEDHPQGVAMLGIGFAREADHQAQSTPDKNPFLSIDTDFRSQHRGYVITRRGVHVGLTQANTRGDYAFIKLASDPKIAGEWQAAPVCLSINDAQPPACGTALMDTGVTTVFLTVPADQVGASAGQTETGAATLMPMTKVGVFLPGPDAVVRASYSFRVGAPNNPLIPDKLLLNAVRKPFINTSVAFLNGFDYLYDADAGLVGYRWTGHAPKEAGSVQPGGPQP